MGPIGSRIKTLVATSDSDPVVIGEVPGLLGGSWIRLVYLAGSGYTAELQRGSQITHLEATVVSRVEPNVEGEVKTADGDGSTASVDVPS